MSNFYEALQARWESTNAMLCVGLDPDPERFPEFVLAQECPIFTFNQAIIDATQQYVCAYKPQIAHYSALGAEDELEMTIDYIKEYHPDIPVILDAKRGDIGSTAEKYAMEAFERYGADAVTVNPYLGADSLQPFLKYKDHGVIILCYTSNDGAKDIQQLDVDGRPLYEYIAEMAINLNKNNNVALVVGATQVEALARVRNIVADMPILVPGIGAQGGDLKAVLTAGRAGSYGLMINASRSILYAGEGNYFAKAAGIEAKKLVADMQAS
jgi:orotidine-5'-phosphate decarboxylase